jgi:flavin-dependent dehydrogenase
MAAHVAIIGAGPAGSAAAIVLARAGRRVTLIEQHRFPRDKVCGECMSADGIDVLEKIGIAKELLQLNPAVFTYAAIHAPDGASVRLPLPRPMWGLSRERSDGLLLETARASGAAVLQPARCEGIEPGGRPGLRIRLLDSNRAITLGVDRIMVADGKGALLPDPPPHTADFGIKAHFEGVAGPRDTIELFGCNGLYGGLAAIEDGRWNAAFSVPAERLKGHRGNVAALFAEIAGENRTLRARLLGARQVGQWLASPLPRFAVRDDWPPGVIAIGNAAAAIEPIGGEGMGLALQSAFSAASSLLHADASDRSALSDRYRRLWRTRRPFCRTAALLVSRPGLVRSLVPIMASSPMLGRAGLRLLGK